MTGSLPQPLIGVPGRRRLGSQVEGFPPTLHALEMDVYLADYSRSVRNAGGLPVNIPIDGDPADYIPHLHGILLTGGADVAPFRYGQTPDGNGGYEPERDDLEVALCTAATRNRLPVLGICRGLQLINVLAGGTLHQHVPPHSRYDTDPATAVHNVRIEANSTLHERHGAALLVNSLHHQTVDVIAPGLRVTARADDGTVEGLESDDGLILAVQWHPEMMSNDDAVFAWLVEQAQLRNGVRRDAVPGR